MACVAHAPNMVVSALHFIMLTVCILEAILTDLYMESM